MKCQYLFPACLLLLWTASVHCAEAPEIEVKKVADGIVLQCNYGRKIKNENTLRLDYKDENTNEYTCEGDNIGGSKKIYVKFRTCDNCIEMKPEMMAGLAVGTVVATAVLGVVVYLVASQTQITPMSSNKKSSDRQHLVPNEVGSRAVNDHYQPLNRKTNQKDTYDVLTNRR